MSTSRVFNPGIAKFSAQPPILAQIPDTGIGRYFISTSKALNPDIGIDIQYWYQWCAIGTYFMSTRRVYKLSIGTDPQYRYQYWCIPDKYIKF